MCLKILRSLSIEHYYTHYLCHALPSFLWMWRHIADTSLINQTRLIWVLAVVTVGCGSVGLPCGTNVKIVHNTETAVLQWRCIQKKQIWLIVLHYKYNHHIFKTKQMNQWRTAHFLSSANNWVHLKQSSVSLSHIMAFIIFRNTPPFKFCPIVIFILWPILNTI